MTKARRATALAVLLVLAWAVPFAAQAPARVTQASLTEQEMDVFLRTATITMREQLTTGITKAVKATLTDGRITHDAQIQSIDTFDREVNLDGIGLVENFRDTYRYNIAAYRLGHLLGLNIPMSVPREVDGKKSAMTWWVDNVAMDEEGRQALSNQLGPNEPRTALQLHMLRVFDELIQNIDRHKHNLLWTKDWTMVLIDHTRSFRPEKKLREPDKLAICEKNLYAAIKGLTRESVTQAVGDSLVKAEIDAVMARRDALVKLFDGKIKKQGEMSVIFAMP